MEMRAGMPMVTEVQLAEQDEEDEEDEEEDGSVSEASTSPSLRDFCDTFCDSAQELAQKLFPDTVVQVDYMPGGSFNRIVCVDLEDGPQFILRLPREKMRRQELETGVALHNHLRSVARHIPVPRVVGHDATTNNSVQCQWMLQERLPGRPLSEVLEDLSILQLTSLAQQMADLLADVFAVPFPGAGRLVASPGGECVVGKPRVLLPPSPHPLSFAGADDQDGAEFHADFQPPTTLLSFFLDRFGELGRVASETGATLAGVYCRELIKLAPIILQQYPLVDISTRGLCLSHPDVAARNILVGVGEGCWQQKQQQQQQKQQQSAEAGNVGPLHPSYPSDCIHVSGLIDWDDASALPPELAYFVPAWLWATGLGGTEEEEGVANEVFNDRLGDDPDLIPVGELAGVRNAFLDQIERHLPGYVAVVRESRACGLRSLGFLARHGLGERDRYALARRLLERFGLGDEIEKAHIADGREEALATEVSLAVGATDTARLKELLRKKSRTTRALVNRRDDRAWSVLLDAADQGKHECLKLLLEAGAEVDFINNEGCTALMRACRYGGNDRESTRCVLLLASAGASVDKRDKDGMTALMLAAFKGKTACVQHLLAAGASVNLQNNNGHSALMGVFMRVGNADTVRVDCTKLLIAASVNVNLSNHCGQTALMKAATCGCTEGGQLLVAAGAASLDMQ